MDRLGTLKRDLITYPCPTCKSRHIHGYNPTEREPFGRVTHCPEETQDVLIYLKK